MGNGFLPSQNIGSVTQEFWAMLLTRQRFGVFVPAVMSIKEVCAESLVLRPLRLAGATTGGPFLLAHENLLGVWG